MALTLRPTVVESPVDKSRQDFTIFSGKWEMGCIYEDRSGPVNLRWFWSLHGIVGKPLAPTAAPRRSTTPSIALLALPRETHEAVLFRPQNAAAAEPTWRN